MGFKYYGTTVSEEFVMYLIESNNVTVDGRLKFSSVDDHLVTVPDLGIEFRVDDFQTHNKVKLLDLCEYALPLFAEYDYVLWKYIVYNNLFCEFRSISMPLSEDVLYLLIEWFATVPSFNAKIFSVEELAYNIRGHFDETNGYPKLIEYFWKCFFLHYSNGLSTSYESHGDLSAFAHNQGCYVSSPYERCVMLFGSDEPNKEHIKRVVFSGIRRYNVLPNKVPALFLTVYGNFDNVMDKELRDMIVEGGSISLYCDDIDMRMGVTIHPIFQLRGACRHITDNLDDPRITKALNLYKIKNKCLPLNGIITDRNYI